MAEPVFRSYDQEALDWEYNNRGKVPDTAECKAAQISGSDEAKAQYHTLLDHRFGSGSTDLLDIYHGESIGPRPVHVFFHGGYWKSNTKNDFGFVAKPFVPYGVTTVVVEYPLIPGVRMDTLIERCRTAMAWVWRNAAEMDCDPDNITVSGHSAGGHITAMLASTDWPSYAEDLPADLVKAGCGISGVYDLEPVRLSFQNDDLQFSPKEAEEFSPVLMTPSRVAPLLLPVGGDEGPEFVRQSEDLASTWSAQGHDVSAWVMQGKHHFTTINEYLDSESTLSKTVRAQIGVS